MTLDAQLSHDDEAARVAALDVSRSFIVQAPAGSGKTELLIQRYLRLLGIVDSPEEILAITFTRKAAAEMQLRVLQALQRAERGIGPAEAYAEITADAAAAALRRDAALQWNLIRHPRRMRIQTLDSLNASIAKTQPLSTTGGAAGNTVAADAEMRRMYRDAATLTLDQLIETGPLRDATEEVLLHLDNNTALYVAYLARMLGTRDQWLPFIGSGLVEPHQEQGLRRRFESNLRGAVTGHLMRLRSTLPSSLCAEVLPLVEFALRHLRNGGQEGHRLCALQACETIPAATADSVPQWQALAELLLTQQGQWRKTVNKLQGFPAGTPERDAMLELLASCADADEFRELLHGVRLMPPTSYSDEQWSVLLSLFRLLPLAVTELKRLFSENGVTDYVEVALCAAEALGSADAPGDVSLLLDYQLRHLLVDEMQDTSSAQYRMLEALTGGWQRGDGRTLFCVGDPMQSIYRFRNAEVGQFLLARRGGIGGLELQPLTLRRNFRSGENLVDWFNAVFPGVLAAHDDAQQSAVSYSAAVAVPRFAGQGRCVVHPLFGSSEAAEAEVGRRVISQTLEGHTDSDMAVLVRSRAQLPRLLALLRQAGIAYRSVEIDRLTDLPEIIDILALTRALVHRGDRLAWLALLRSPWAGLDWSDLHTLVCGEPQATIWELLHRDERIAQLSVPGCDAALNLRNLIGDELRAGRGEALRDRIERLWLILGGPGLLDDDQAVENVYRYLEVIERLEIAGTLTDVAQLEDALDLERVSSDSKARLQVMTMHRAKGLQFDHVMLYGLGRTPGSHEREVLSWFDIPGEHGADEKVISPVGPRAEVEADPLHRFIEKTEAVKNRNEAGRLLYVACTRARQSLHLVGHVEVAANGQAFRPPRTNSLLRLLWAAVAADFERVFVSSRGSPVEDHGAAFIMPVRRCFTSPWTLPEPVALPGESSQADADAQNRAVEYYWVGSEARSAGSVVHRWLQAAANDRVNLQQHDKSAIRTVSERWLAEMGVGRQSFSRIVARVEAALAGISADERGQWLLGGEGYAELALTGLHRGQVESVVLDRVRIDADGTHWIVDYKASTHEGGNLAAFLEAEADRYRPQLQKYAELYRNYSGAAVRCALYFPLLQQFVEVPPG
ncbi:MAG: UvrD-helicase domain-containing protein [Gammaproteobacteria bacterium]|nr:UvrD-helicase domain-containing protein [Gammaproteobacteria bacterium]